MLIVETIAKVRRMFYVQKKKIKAICRELNLSRNTVRDIIRNDKTSKSYERTIQKFPALDEFVDRLRERLEADILEPKRRRRTAKKLYDELCTEGFVGSYSAVSRFVQNWKREKHKGVGKTFIPLEFSPGKAFQFDWSEEEIKLKGELTRVKAAHIRLCHSRFFLIIAYRNEQLEMVMDAHDRAFQFFYGVPKKGIYDNMKTAVQKILIGKNRKFNTRFAEMASHYLFEPIACTPASGWEKGQVENQVSTGRRNFFTPLVCVDSLEELNEQLSQKCIDWAKKMKHPTVKEKTVWDMYEEEKKYFLEYRCPFDAYKVECTVVSSYSLVRYETNLYSVYCSYVGNTVEIRAYATKIIIVCKNEIIGEHKRCFEKNKKLPKALNQIRKNLGGHSDGDRQFVKILVQVQVHGLKKVDAVCAQALENGICNADFITDYLSGNNCKKSIIEKDEYPKIETPPDNNCGDYTKLLLLFEEVGHA
jgi:transposase